MLDDHHHREDFWDDKTNFFDELSLHVPLETIFSYLCWKEDFPHVSLVCKRWAQRSYCSDFWARRFHAPTQHVLREVSRCLQGLFFPHRRQAILPVDTQGQYAHNVSNGQESRNQELVEDSDLFPFAAGAPDEEGGLRHNYTTGGLGVGRADEAHNSQAPRTSTQAHGLVGAPEQDVPDFDLGSWECDAHDQHEIDRILSGRRNQAEEAVAAGRLLQEPNDHNHVPSGRPLQSGERWSGDEHAHLSRPGRELQGVNEHLRVGSTNAAEQNFSVFPRATLHTSEDVVGTNSRRHPPLEGGSDVDQEVVVTTATFSAFAESAVELRKSLDVLTPLLKQLTVSAVCPLPQLTKRLRNYLETNLAWRPARCNPYATRPVPRRARREDHGACGDYDFGGDVANAMAQQVLSRLLASTTTCSVKRQRVCHFCGDKNMALTRYRVNSFLRSKKIQCMRHLNPWRMEVTRGAESSLERRLVRRVSDKLVRTLGLCPPMAAQGRPQQAALMTGSNQDGLGHLGISGTAAHETDAAARLPVDTNNAAKNMLTETQQILLLATAILNKDEARSTPSRISQHGAQPSVSVVKKRIFDKNQNNEDKREGGNEEKARSREESTPSELVLRQSNSEGKIDPEERQLLSDLSRHTAMRIQYLLTLSITLLQKFETCKRQMFLWRDAALGLPSTYPFEGVRVVLGELLPPLRLFHASHSMAVRADRALTHLTKILAQEKSSTAGGYE
ncbi:unnamed protein product [Amoebophrya sp. A120]|nr:unnamed protein product [Amoebophrya sp. A120]|eukprot:GSA120T00006723001.1